jgi:hypothetical protein
MAARRQESGATYVDVGKFRTDWRGGVLPFLPAHRRGTYQTNLG